MVNWTTTRRGGQLGSRLRWSVITATRAPAAALWIRAYVGVVFFNEGILKFLQPHALGAGRFERAGIPLPGFFAPLDGVCEVTCGLLIMLGLNTRLAAVPMIVDMLGALLITKIPILWSSSKLFPKESGWWDFIHESRIDVAQFCGSVFLSLVGAGALSLDAVTQRSPTPATGESVARR
jgi:uncharacterized membrane protein YphA (DoxX/SURF4 family)